jgi:hypothetical protein
MKQLFGRLGKAMGLMLTVSGGIVTGILLLIMLLGQLSGGWLVLLLVPLISLGLLPLGLGAAILYASQKIVQEAVRDRFYQMLRQDQGRISLLRFADRASLEPAIARQHLDAWARECDATFDVTDDGDIYYVFTTSPRSLPFGGAAFNPTKLMEKVIEKLV